MKLTHKGFLAAIMAALALPGCAPLVIGAVAAGTAIVATDRRSTGAQFDDKTIQVRVANELQEALRGNDIHINVNSYEKRVLLTGEVNNEAIKAQASAVATRSKDVRMVNNELIDCDAFILRRPDRGQHTGNACARGVCQYARDCV